MSTSEFDGCLQDPDEDPSARSLSNEGLLPDDFSEDDLAFAHELQGLFSPADEELPPYFVQTLLDAENAQFRPVSQGFEQRTYARVFRHLHLHRQLFRFSLWQWFAQLWPIQRTSIAVASSCFIFMLATMVATSNAFASGMTYLLAGPHTGVVETRTLPDALDSVRAPQQQMRAKAENATKQISLFDTASRLQFPFYWPSYLPTNFTMEDAYLIQNQGMFWTDGPILQLVSNYSAPGLKPHGTGKITIWEFKPRVKVIQNVSLGSAHALRIGPDGQAAITVDGQWVYNLNNRTHEWVHNGQLELIYEHDGVIFWIQGDQRDGVTQEILGQIAVQLSEFSVQRIYQTMGHVNSIQQSSESPAWMVRTMLVDNPDGPTLLVLPPEMPPQGGDNTRDNQATP
ncbi:hypothetical protein [Ktedonospora formicarum]|uniref:Uncharacterized protein n=1 Tax=Ktedonospora formicarum TaxID=2778364 RepID=A0A8J3HZK7_9CHLR|nr:hypothetical protein [Ktedonospora formicarum]GHO43552.1 hypothetical protein KSX_17150 [Ktedonospora formicarum]